MKKYFLIYIDILGFEKLPKKEAEKSRLEPEEIREIYRRRIETRLSKLKEAKTIQDYTKKEYKIVLHTQEVTLDSWLLFTDSIWSAFRSVGEVLETDLSLEVAIGTKEFRESPAGDGLIALRDETISCLKSKIIGSYHGIAKGEIRQTFILLTMKAYENLDSKNMCYDKVYKSSEGELFYLVKQNEFEKNLKVLKFLEKIGSRRPEYREIDTLYVEPENYSKIRSILEDNNVVFIIGDAEMGKTYTAIKLLLNFYGEDYEPVYIPAEWRKEQWKFIKEGSELKGKAVYLEDPWGKVEFERSESLFRDIGSLIREVKRQKCKVIISSREKVFKEFEKKKETTKDLWKYVSKLRINLAYGKEKLIEMLKRYIDVFKPVWHENKNLRKIAFESVGRKIRTPMSIKQLIDNTMGARDEESLIAGVERVAKETNITFAREIKEMFEKKLYDNLVFLSFPYIRARLEVAKSCYQDVLLDLKELGYDLIKAKDFDSLLEEFINKEVEISSLLFYDCIEYLHSLYKEAFGNALVDNNRPNNISKKIFSKVLVKLSEKDEAAGDVARAVADNFDKLPEEVRNKLLFKLSEKDKAAWAVALAVADNFDKLPERVRNLLFKLSEKDEAAGYVALAVASNFDKLPERVRNLLFNLSEKDKSAGTVALAVASNFDKIPKKARNLLFKLSEKDEAARAVARAVADNFDKLPEEVRNKLLFKLSEKDEAARAVARAVADNFSKLPEEVRNKLLFKLSEKDEAAEAVAWAVADNFDKLPEEARNKLLFKLSEKDKAAEAVAWAVADNFDKLPEEVRNLLFKLSEKNEAAGDVTMVVVDNFDKLPEEVRNKLLFKLSEKDKAAWAVALAVADNFDKLPEEVRNLLDRLQESLQYIIEDLSDENPGEAIRLISNARPKIDESFALKILGELSKDEDEKVRMDAEVLMNSIQG